MKRTGILCGFLGLSCVHATEPLWPSVRQAALDHPGLENARHAGRQAQSDATFSGQPSVPTVELELENLAGTGKASGLGGSTVGAWVGNQFRLGDMRTAQKQLAKSQADLSGLDTLAHRQTILWAARMAHEEWIQTNARARSIDSSLREIASLLEHARKALALGNASPWEISRLEGDLQERTAQRDLLRQSASLAWDRQFTGRALLPEPAQAPMPDSLEPCTSPLATPAMLRQTQELAVRQAQVRLLEQEDRPGLEGAMGVLRDQASGDVSLGVRVQLPLVWSRTSLETRRARSEASLSAREATARRQERARQGLLRNQRIAAARLERTRAQESVVARQKTLTLMEDAHRKGALDPFAIWTAREALWAARVRAQESLLTMRTLELERQMLEGCEP